MLNRRLSRIAPQAAAVGAALALAACGAQPYPEPAEAPPPPPPSAALMGGPEAMPHPPLPAPGSAPYAPQGAYPGAAPGPAQAEVYQPSGPVIIAMAPIPNPPEAEPRPRRAVPHPAEPAPTYRHEAPARPHAAVPPVPARPAYQSGAVAPHKAARVPAPHAAAPAAPHKAAPRTAAVHVPAPKAAPHAAAPRVAQAPPVLKPATPKLGPVPVLKAAPAANATSPLGDRATRLAAMEMSLAEAAQGKARLTVPSSLNPNTPSDVSLSLPADFVDTLKAEAGKNELSDAAAAVNITSLLSGDGYVITPDATQSQPLVAGKPTEFHWTVTAMPNAKGLHADLGADLIGAGSDRLNLGTIAPAGGGSKLSPRILGACILILIAGLMVAALARGRSVPTRSNAARREARRARSGPSPVRAGPDNPF